MLKELGEPAFRAKQVYGWLQKGADYAAMRNLPAALTQKLQEKMPAQGVKVEKIFTSALDGTKKLLYLLQDGNLIEGVLMKYSYGNTLCVSTQVGCKMGCKFCASTLEGCVRSLTAGEILSQVLAVNALEKDGDKRGVTNVVLMGSGEPLDNYENVLKFLHLLSAPEGICISLRNVSLSTCGLVEQMDRLAAEDMDITLSISLHAPTDEKRRELMPVANRWPLKELMAACKRYEQKTNRRITFEYALIEGKNTDLADADALAKLIGGMRCHVNLIPVNEVKERGMLPPQRKQTEAFLNRLTELGVSATIRREMGSDIGGACGQLRRSYIAKEQG